MNSGPPWVEEIEKQTASKRVLVVEGKDDCLIVEKWLGLLEPNFRARLHVNEANGRNGVQQALKHRPAWFGLEDRDEWTDTEIQTRMAEYPNLQFLPRYCLENYFLLPDEVWPLIPPPQQTKYPGGKSQFESDIHDRVDGFVPHWCMWVVLRVRRRQLLEMLQFPDALIERMLEKPPLEKDDIEAQLKTWHDQLDASKIFKEYQDLMSQVKGKTPDEKLKAHVHGKKFFERIMTEKVLKKIEQKGSRKWLSDLAEGITTVPSDIQSILEDFLA